MKNKNCNDCAFSNLDNGVLYCAMLGVHIKDDEACSSFTLPRNQCKDEYIDPLVTRDEMASITSEIKSESYTKISRLIQYLMEEYLVEDVRIEKVFEADKEFYRAKLTYREFPF